MLIDAVRLFGFSERCASVRASGLTVLDVASVAKRARGENFPVASLAFPRQLRPHIRALYAYARLVDILGDELERKWKSSPFPYRLQ